MTRAFVFDSVPSGILRLRVRGLLSVNGDASVDMDGQLMRRAKCLMAWMFGNWDDSFGVQS